MREWRDYGWVAEWIRDPIRFWAADLLRGEKGEEDDKGVRRETLQEYADSWIGEGMSNVHKRDRIASSYNEKENILKKHPDYFGVNRIFEK